jgi:hypothetical protein
MSEESREVVRWTIVIAAVVPRYIWALFSKRKPLHE